MRCGLWSRDLVVLRDLARELERCGVRGRDRSRALAETEDHLRELSAEHGEQEAVTRFGESPPLAREIAAQLATTRTIRSTYAVFAALALTGFAYVAFLALVEDGGGWPDLFGGDHAALGPLAALGLFLFPQLAVVAGGLALLRALRRRGGGVLPSGELGVIRSRAATALAAGALTVTSMALWGLEFRDLTLIAGLCVVSLLNVGTGAAALLRSAALRSSPGGTHEDLFDDLRLESLRSRPWLFATGVALLAAIPAFVTNGQIMAGVELGAVLLCFAALGRRLALRP